MREGFVTNQWMCWRNFGSLGHTGDFYWFLSHKSIITKFYASTVDWLKIMETRYRLNWFDRYINFSLLGGPLQVKSNALHQICSVNTSQYLCKALCWFDENLIIYSQFCLNVYFNKSLSVAKLLILALFHIQLIDLFG